MHTYRLPDEVEEAIFSPDDQYVLTRLDQNTAILFSFEGDSLHVLKHPAKVNSISFAHDNKGIITSCRDNIVRWWSTDGMLMDTLVHTESTTHAKFTKSGKHILSGNNKIYIHKVNGEVIDSLQHGDNGVTAVDVSPDQSLILTTSYDGNAYLWNFEGKKLSTYQGHTGSVSYGCFTRDGKHILTTSNEGEILRWSIPKAIYEELQTRKFYEFTREQLEEYEIVK